MSTFEHPGQEVANSNEPPSHGIQLILMAQSWGPKNGGINAFNTDFAKALGRQLGPDRVVCVTLEATPEEVADAAADHVRLIPVAPGRREFDPMYAEAVLRVIGEKGIVTGPTTFWIGHDVHTGPAALRVAELAGHGRSVVIQHMSYGDYISFRDGIGQKALEKQRRQEELYRQAAVVFAVGPLLRDRLREIVHDQGKSAHMIVPGLADIQPSDAPRAVYRAVAMGRLGPTDDRIKQGRLAVAAVASAIRMAHENPAWPEGLKKAEMWLYGIDQPGGAEEAGLRKLAGETAGRGVNLAPLPFTHDRPRLLRDLSHCDVALMLSWHEGFGLTGWEAIAAGVPLIVSENSGLYQLIDESLGAAGLALFEHLHIRGWDDPEGDENFHDDDVTDVRQHLLVRAKNRDKAKAKTNALQLRKMLLDKGYTWDNTAASFINDLPKSGPDPGDFDTIEIIDPELRHAPPECLSSPTAVPDTELLETARKLIAALLEQSERATERLAVCLKEPYAKDAGCRCRIADKILNEDLHQLFDLVLDESCVLRKVGETRAADVMTSLVYAVLPAKHAPDDIARVIDGKRQAAGHPVPLLASHKTIAEIVMAGADRRPAWFVPPRDKDEFPAGRGLIAQVAEGGRDPEGWQLERDLVGELAETYESRFDERLAAGFESFLKDRYKRGLSGAIDDLSEEGRRVLVAWIRGELVRDARGRRRQLDPGCGGFTFYFVVQTPEGLTDADRMAQDSVLGRLKSRFPEIAFLRLAPARYASMEQLLPYSELRSLLHET